jgi:hypothetical protein
MRNAAEYGMRGRSVIPARVGGDGGREASRYAAVGRGSWLDGSAH